MRVMYVLYTFPQLSQTYIKNEIEALKDAYDIDVIAMKPPNLPYKTTLPHRFDKHLGSIAEKIRAFRPHVMHTHRLEMVPVLERLSRKTGVPYTVRSHSVDTLNNDEKYNPIDGLVKWFKGQPNYRGFRPEHVVKYLNGPNCLGMLAFPYARPRLEKAGVSRDKIVDCFPVIAYSRFLDRGPNGDAVMNTGACIPKKRMEDFVDLGGLVPQRPFHLYAIGYESQVLRDYNKSKGNPIEVVPTVEPEEMPAVYKKHQWMVYTADFADNTVGWPMAVAESQAAGVGVCVPDIRRDLQDYLGGAGYVYDSIADVAKIIRNDVPAEIRERGFEQARKSDIEGHKHLLANLWESRRPH